jgi:hypothetical protein
MRARRQAFQLRKVTLAVPLRDWNRGRADAGVTAVSADRRFATAYNAALLTAHMVIACAGYRVTAKTGHHKVAFDAICSSISCRDVMKRVRARNEKSASEPRKLRLLVLPNAISDI